MARLTSWRFAITSNHRYHAFVLRGRVANGCKRIFNINTFEFSWGSSARGWWSSAHCQASMCAWDMRATQWAWSRPLFSICSSMEPTSLHASLEAGTLEKPFETSITATGLVGLRDPFLPSAYMPVATRNGRGWAQKAQKLFPFWRPIPNAVWYQTPDLQIPRRVAVYR